VTFKSQFDDRPSTTLKARLHLDHQLTNKLTTAITLVYCWQLSTVVLSHVSIVCICYLDHSHWHIWYRQNTLWHI